MFIGITGTRNGLTEEQKIFVAVEIPWDAVKEIHTGDCVGVDKELHDFAKSRGVLSVGHPPIKEELRAYCDFDITEEVRSYLRRNRDIVNSSDKVYAFPPTEEDSGYGGTWYTIRYAKRVKKRLVVVTPKGKVKKYN